jgi:hypothetical protein
MLLTLTTNNTGHTQTNGAVSKVDKEFISLPIRTQLTTSASGLSRSLMRYQQFTSHAYCGAARLVSKMASQQEKAFCEVPRSVITVQREFRAQFKKDTPHKNSAIFKPCTKLTLHCNHRSGHLKTEHTESLLLLRRQLGNWSRGPLVSMRSEMLVAYEKLGKFLLLTVYVVPA